MFAANWATIVVMLTAVVCALIGGLILAGASRGERTFRCPNPQCRRHNRVGARYCAYCGKPLAPADSAELK